MATVFLDWYEHAPPEYRGGAATVGNFDGVHAGHRALIAAARARARALSGPTIAVTFDPPPYQLLHPQLVRPPLTTIPDRIALLEAAGVDHVIVLRTSPALLALSPEAFFEDVLVRQLGAGGIVEGYDFRFGRGRAGNNDTLRKLCAAAGLAFEEVPQCLLGGQPVSSSRIREALSAGEVARAAELLGRCYSITGTVIAGARRGRTIGFPTANLAEIHSLLPGNGVYAVRGSFGGKTYPAAANIGPNPTFGEDARKIEVHLIDYSGDLYGRQLGVEFVARLRDTRPFSSSSELIEQLQHDVAQARKACEVRS
jgi:riboflavin kinase/FMN adenylyltransferase